MPTPDIKIEVTTDMQAVINDLVSEIDAETQKMKASLKDNKAAADIIKKLEAVQDECVRIYKECKVMIPLHNDALGSEGQEFTDKWRICRAQFLPKNDLIGANVKAGKLNIPPLTDASKNELSKTTSPKMMALVVNYHGEVTELRTMVQKLWGKVLANHVKMNDYVKKALDIRNQVNPDGAVPPPPPLSVAAPKPSMPSAAPPPRPSIPSAPALNQATQVHPAPLSSSHGAKNAESQQKAAQASAAKVPYVRASKPLPGREK